MQPSRSAQMVQCLRENLLYTEKRPRDLLFGVIERLLVEKDRERRYILSRLIREAASRARIAAQNDAVICSNWDIASQAAINAMLAAEVFVAEDGRPISQGVTARATIIGGLKPNFRDLTEAYLIEFLIRKLGTVRVNDHLALAHALFRQFDPNIPVGELEDRVVMLLATLADRVTLRENATYALREVDAQSERRGHNAASA